MATQATTFTNGLGELMAWLLLPLRSIGFFEPQVFMTLMTLASILLFLFLQRKIRDNTTPGEAAPLRGKLAGVAYFLLCFFVTNVTAVALKTLIREELDYTTDMWFIPYVGPLHFFIASVIIAYLFLLVRNRSTLLDGLLCLYVQGGLVGGFAIALYRLQHESFSLFDVTTGVSGVFMLAVFSIYNWDIVVRFARCIREGLQLMRPSLAP